MRDHTIEPQEVPLKRCKKCEERKPATAEYFEPAKGCKDGIRNECKSCRNSRKKILVQARDAKREENTDKSAPVRLRQCTKCKDWKPATIEYFDQDRGSIDGLRTRCKVCKKQHREANKEHESEYSKSYYAANKEKRLATARAWQTANKERWAEYNREYHAANKERYAERNREYHAANKKTLLKRNRDYHRKKREQIRERKCRYNQNDEVRDRKKERARLRFAANPNMNRVKHNRRKARKRNAGGYHTASDIATLYERQCSKCAYCQCEVGNTYHVDHIVPLARGGSNWPDNLAIACPPCNHSKYDKLLYTEWMPPNPL